MSLPQSQLSATPYPAPFLSPDNHSRTSPLYDMERGGVALNDPSEGINGYDWKVWAEINVIKIARAPYDNPTTVITTAAAIYWISLAFDQNMRPTIAYMESNKCMLYWYDTVTASPKFSAFADCTSPMLCMDDKRDGADSYNDVLFFYLRAGRLWYRMQRDRYNVEYDLGEVPTWANRIDQVGMSTNGRLQVRLRPWNVVVAATPSPLTATCDLGSDACTVVGGIEVCATAQVPAEACLTPAPNTDCMIFESAP